MFRGLQKLTLVDYPGHTSCTVFTGGCSFRCPWCHNPTLVHPEKLERVPRISDDTIRQHLLSRSGKIEGICFTGGEPTLWGDRLADFMNWSRSAGFRVKLDTNGYHPEILEGYIQKGLVDFIAMDIKNSGSKYAKTVGIPDTEFQLHRITDSIQLILDSGVPFRFRTTDVPNLVDRRDVIYWLSGTAKQPVDLVFQEYREVLPESI